MDINDNNDYFSEKVSFNCSIKNCQKNFLYKIIISNNEKSLGEFSYKETEELKAEKNKTTLNFKELNGIEFIFSQKQLFTIIIMKKSPFSPFYDSFQRQTIMASLVSSENSIYERKVNEKDINSEIFMIEVKEEESLRNSENMQFFDIGILNYFKKGGKLKLLFFFDFFGKDIINDDFLKSANIFHNLVVNFYNYCQLYTFDKEAYIYKLKESQNIFNSLTEEHFNIFNKFDDIKKYFLDCLNNGLIDKRLCISSFIDITLNEIEKNFFNIVFIFVRDLPEDIKIVLDKIEKIKNENNPMNVVFINAGNKFPDYLSNKIKEHTNIILIENQDDSQKILLNIAQTCLNQIRNNIIEFKRNQNDKDENDDNDNETNNNKNIFISDNYGASINSIENNNETHNKKTIFISGNYGASINSIENNNDAHNKKSILISGNYEASINSIENKNEINNNKDGKKVLKTSLSESNVSNCENPWSNPKKNSSIIPESMNESEMSRREEEEKIEEEEEQEEKIDEKVEEKKEEEKIEEKIEEEKEDKINGKNIEKKIVDSKAKTEYTSVENK